MNGTIIYAVDALEGDDAGIRAAVDLADRFDARVVVVELDRLDALEPTGSSRPDLRRFRSDDRVEHRVETGDPVDTIVEVAGEEAASLILVPARPGVLRRTLRSPTARDLVDAAPCPVLVVPPGGRAVPASTPRLVSGRARS